MFKKFLLILSILCLIPVSGCGSSKDVEQERIEFKQGLIGKTFSGIYVFEDSSSFVWKEYLDITFLDETQCSVKHRRYTSNDKANGTWEFVVNYSLKPVGKTYYFNFKDNNGYDFSAEDFAITKDEYGNYTVITQNYKSNVPMSLNEKE